MWVSSFRSPKRVAPVLPYFTDFPLTENPISESGRWVSPPSYWHSQETGSGRCYPATPATAAADDCVAIYAGPGVNPLGNYIEGYLYWAGNGSYQSSSTHEAQLGVGCVAGATTLRLYEMNFSHNGLFQGGRWDGDPNTFGGSAFVNQNGGPGGWGHNTFFRIEFEVISTVPNIRVYQDGQLRGYIQDTDASGNGPVTVGGPPAIIGFFRPTGDVVPANYCWEKIWVGNL